MRAVAVARRGGNGLGHVLSQPRQVDPETHEGLRSHALALTEETEQAMLRADEVVSKT